MDLFKRGYSYNLLDKLYLFYDISFVIYSIYLDKITERNFMSNMHWLGEYCGYMHWLFLVSLLTDLLISSVYYHSYVSSSFPIEHYRGSWNRINLSLSL